MRDGETVSQVGAHGGFALLHGVNDDLRIGREFSTGNAGDDLLDSFRHGGGLEIKDHAGGSECIGERDRWLRALRVEFITDLADELLEHILDRDNARPFAVAVYHDRYICSERR